jgi:putative PIN family toxin of toxin-antitoxin system
MRIMIDTNILISIIFFPSEKMNEIKTKLAKNHQIVICSYVIDELKTVTIRKFPHKLKAIDDFFTQLPFELVYTPEFYQIKDLPNIRDDKDKPILVSEILSDVDILLTGDKDFNNIEIERPEILTPSEFLRKY